MKEREGKRKVDEKGLQHPFSRKEVASCLRTERRRQKVVEREREGKGNRKREEVIEPWGRKISGRDSSR